MNGYDLSRQWFDFAFEKTECKVQHTALYLWIVELNNRLGWKKEFGLPTNATMEGLGIGNRGTYAKTLSDLKDWGFIEIVQESKNQYQACIIKLCLFNNEQAERQALDQALIRHSDKQSSGIDTGTVRIDKPRNNETNKQGNNETDVDADRVDVEEVFLDEEKKIDPPPKVAPKGSPTLHASLKEIIEKMNDGYYWQAKDGKALKGIITKISFRWKNKHGSDPSDADVINSFRWMLDNLPEWFKDKWDTILIESKFEVIIKQILEDRKNGKSNNDNQSTGGVSSRLQDTWELLAQSRKPVNT